MKEQATPMSKVMKRKAQAAARKTKLLEWAEIIDAWRLWPRLFLVAYFYHLHTLVFWYITLPNPTTEQTAMVGAITALFVPLTKWYMENGVEWPLRVASKENE